LTPGQRDDQARGFLWIFARGEDHLGDASAQVSPEVEPCATTKLVELHAAQLRERFVFGQLTRDQAAEDISHSASSTSRIRCQCVPAQ
jgi:hypothetical protein